jgi:hypothetical protein
MKKQNVNRFKAICGSVVFIISLSMFSSTYAVTGTSTGKISSIYTYHTGMVLVTGLTFAGATCTHNTGFFIAGDHPHLKTFMSSILAAKAMGSDITVKAKIDNCWYPEITATTGESTRIVIK